MAGFTHLGNRGSAPEIRRDPVEPLGVEQADQASKDADEGEPSELRRIAEAVRAHVAEKGTETLDRSEDGIAHRRGDETGQQSSGVEVVAVEDLGCKHGATERRTKDRSDARADARRHRDAPVGRVQLEHARKQGPEPRADLARRTFTSA